MGRFPRIAFPAGEYDLENYGACLVENRPRVLGTSGRYGKARRVQHNTWADSPEYASYDMRCCSVLQTGHEDRYDVQPLGSQRIGQRIDRCGLPSKD